MLLTQKLKPAGVRFATQEVDVLRANIEAGGIDLIGSTKPLSLIVIVIVDGAPRE